MEFRQLQELLIRAAAEARAASIAAAIHAQGTSAAIAVGLRSLHPPAAATPNTIYGIASITKTLTAIAVMQLIEKGVLSLDDPADKYLPIELRVKGKPVTIEHLLSHTSGIPAPGYAEAQVAAALQTPDAPWLPIGGPREVLLLLEKAARDWAIAEPGERYFYLNEGYVALGVIIEKASGETYSEYIERHITGPLGMRATSIGAPRGEAAQPTMPNEAGLPGPAPRLYFLWSDGGGYSTVLDLLKLARLLLGKGSLDGTELLARSSVEEMEKPRAQLPTQPRWLKGNEFDAYGLGLSIHHVPGIGKLYGHSGALPGYSGYMGYSREAGAAAALLSNTMLSGREYAAEALAAATGHSPESLPHRRLWSTLTTLEGEYIGYMGLVAARVRRLGGDYLLIESIRPPGLLQAVLEPVDIDNQMHMVFETSSRARRLQVVFRAEKGEVEMLYERYRLVKRSP